MTRAAIFTQADIERALKAAQKAGVIIAAFEITPDGRIIVRSREDEEQPKGWGE